MAGTAGRKLQLSLPMLYYSENNTVLEADKFSKRLDP